MPAEFVPTQELDQLKVVLLRSLQGPPPPSITELNVLVGEATLQEEQINPAAIKPSVKRIEQEENGADADHRAEDEGVPSLPQVDSLDEIVDGWETV